MTTRSLLRIAACAGLILVGIGAASAQTAAPAQPPATEQGPPAAVPAPASVPDGAPTQAPAPSPPPAPAAVLPALPAPNAAPQPDTASVNVPNFWDPRARLSPPAPGEIGGIRFLAADDFPPFAFRDRRGILTGFDIDLADAICAVLKVPCAIQTRPFETLKAGLTDGTGNAIIAGLDPERAGAEGLIATQAYLKIPGRFAVRADTTFEPGPPVPTGFVGVTCGSAHQGFLERFFPELRVACYSRPAAALAELKAGKLAAVFGDALGLAFWLHGAEAAECCRFAGGAFIDDRYFGAGLSIVLKGEDRKLKQAIDYALREVYRSGRYEELYLRYFPVSLF